MLVDKDLKVAGAYDSVTNLGLIRLVTRTVVGVGADGKIAFFKRGMPSTDEILAAVAPSGSPA